MTTTPPQNKGAGFYIGWVGVPTAITAGAIAAIAQGTVAGVTSGMGMLVTTSLILLRRFWK